MNHRPNKKKSTSRGGGRGKVPERHLMTVEGVYGNHRFMQAVGTLVGLPVQVVTKTKETFDGVLTTFGPNFELVLDLPHLVLNEDSSLIKNPDSIKRKMIFAVKDIVIIKVSNVDLEYATRESFVVDSVISKYNGPVSSEKELEPWISEEPAYAGLELENANGWDADDMFKKNEEKYGVTTTYSPDLEGYTTPLQKKDTKEWKEQEAKANKVAYQIEHSPLTQTRAEIENGEDEEEKFSAVIRPDQGSGSMSSGKYMPPQRRKIQGSGNNKQPSRGTPSPQSGGPSPMPSGGRYNSHSSTSTPAPYSSNSSQSSSMSSSASGPPMGSPYPPQQTQVKHHPHKHNVSQQLPSGGSGHQHSNQRDPKLNGDPKDSRRHENSHPAYGRESSVHKESYHSHHGSQAHHQHQQQYSHQLYQQQQHPSAYHPTDRRSEPREQREPRKPRNQKEEQVADFKKFHQDFKLSETSDKKVPQHSQQLAPQTQTQTHISTSSATTSLAAPKHHHSSHPMQQSPVSQGTSQPPQPPPQSHQPQHQNIPSVTAQRQSSTPENQSIGPSGALAAQQQPPPQPSPTQQQPPQQPQQQQQQQPPQQPPPPAPSQSSSTTSSSNPQTPVTPQESKGNEEEKSALANSKLNPNAKPFSPRPPSTTTPPRVQTPQIAPTQSQIGFQQNMVHAYLMQPFPVQSQQRFPKRGPVNNQRTDYTSSMQVAAATGHPILAPAPLTSINSPQSIPTVQIPQNMMPQTPQPYQYQGVPMMLRLPPPGIPMVTTMVPTSMGMYYQGGEGHQNSQGHTPQHMYVAPGVPPHQAHQPHPAATPGPHPGQPPTPQGHNNAGGPAVAAAAAAAAAAVAAAPPPNMPTQPPTPGPTPPQAMMYSGPGGAPMGGQPTIPQHLPQHSPHTGQSPHNPYTSNAALAAAAAAAAAASHQPHATQLVMLPPHMNPHVIPPAAPPPPHSGAGHAPSSAAAGYTPTSSAAAAMQHLNHGHPVQYIPGNYYTTK